MVCVRTVVSQQRHVRTNICPFETSLHAAETDVHVSDATDVFGRLVVNDEKVQCVLLIAPTSLSLSCIAVSV